LAKQEKVRPPARRNPKHDKGKAPAFTNWQKISTLGIHAIALGAKLDWPTKLGYAYIYEKAPDF
jgi:hypothetical protein